jgi:hypothetical protein
MELVRNPFRKAAAGTAWDPPVADLPSLNQKAFSQVLGLLHQVAGDGNSFAMALFGEAGSGKTHLLGRLQRHCAELGGRPFVALRMDCAPSRIWRHIRAEFVNSLQRGQRDTWRELLRERQDKIEAVSSGNLRRVLRHIANGHHQLDAMDWLRGAPLSQATLERLDLGDAVTEFDEESEDAARAVVLDLAQFLAPAPILLAIDQLEAIQSHPADMVAFAQLGKACSTLIDSTRNVALLLCIQEAFLTDFHNALRQADRDRLLQERASLPRIGFAEARELVLLRLAGFEQLSERWPVDLEALRAQLTPSGDVVRRVLHVAAALFDASHGVPPPKPLDTKQYLADKFDSIRDHALDSYSFARVDHILTDGMRLLLHSGGWTLEESPPHLPGPVISARKGSQRRHLVMMNDAEARTLPPKLKKILQHPEVVPEVAILRDQALGVSAQAKATHALIGDFKNRQGKFLSLQQDAIAALEAMAKLLREARERNLMVNGEALGDVFVEQWLRDNLPEPIAALERELELDGPSVNLSLEGLSAFLRGALVATMEEAATATGITPQQVEEFARNHPEQFFVFGGDTPVVAARVVSAGGE